VKIFQMVTLGGCSLLDAGGSPVVIPTRKQMALLAYMAMHPGKIFTRASLAPIFWGDDDEARARHSLSQALYDLKRVLGTEVICTRGQLVWIPNGVIVVDAQELVTLAGDASTDAALRAGHLYQGDFLAGIYLDEEQFDYWVLAEQDRIRRIAQSSVGNFISVDGASGSSDDLLQMNRTLLKADPFDEQAHCRIMEIYARQGTANMAVAHFEKLAADMQRELDMLPSEKIRAIYLAIRNQTLRPAPFRIEDYAFIVEQIPQAVVVTDLSHKIVGWNSRSEQLLGFSKAEIYGQSLTVLYAPGRKASMADNVLSVARERGNWTGEVSLQAKDGHDCFQRRIVAPLFTPDGVCVGAFGQELIS